MQDFNNIPSRKIVAQLVMPRISADDYFSDNAYKASIHQLIDEGVGGFCVFKGGTNETASMLEELQSIAEIPLLFSSDFEYGLPMRLSEGTSFPHSMALGQANNYENTYKIAQAIACEARAIGVCWNFAPVCDVNSNPKNPIINIRSFGEDCETVENHSAAFILGTQSMNVIACAKHFPGHGDTSVDSHLSLPVLPFDENRLTSLELKPFVNAIKSGVRSIMVGHLAVPSLDKSNTPASLYSPIITSYLKEKMGFSGLIITDALDMKAITNLYPAGKASVLAISAGADIALLPENPFEAIDALELVFNDNELFANQCRSSFQKIIAEKKWCGILKNGKFVLQKKKPDFVSHEKLALRAAFAAVKIDGNNSLLPLQTEKNVAGFAFIQGEDLQPGTTFFRVLAQAAENDCDLAFIDENISNEQIEDLIEGTKNADIILFACFNRAKAYSGTIGLSQRIADIFSKISNAKPTIAVLFGNPYMKSEIKADTYISTFTDSLPGIGAAVLKLSGRTLDFY